MSTEIARTPAGEIVQAQPAAILGTPMAMLAHAVAQGNTEMVKTLAGLAADARVKDEIAAFNRSMHTAQGEMRRIGVDANNPQTRSKYLTYAKMDAALRPIYTQHGFSVSFNTAQGKTDEMLRVIAYVSHQDGYTREYQIDMPADGKGAKGGDVMTKTHATGAAASYGARYLLKMIFNVAVGETDDDGNGAGGGRGLPEPEIADRVDAIRAAQSEEELKSVWTKANAAARKVGDVKAQQLFAREGEARKAQL